MNTLVRDFQTTIFEMFINGRLTEGEFNLLSILTENIENPDVLEIILMVGLPDLEDQDFKDCILVKQFKTARLIIKE